MTMLHVNYSHLQPLFEGVPFSAHALRERIRSLERSEKISDARKILAAQLRNEGYSITAIADEMNCSRQNVHYLICCHYNLLETSADYQKSVQKCKERFLSHEHVNI